LFLPFGIVLNHYKRKKALPTNIKTLSGRNFKAIPITTEYGIIFTEEKYVDGRLNALLKNKAMLDAQSDSIIREINSLSFEARESLLNEMPTDNDR
jgi:hypothetical protein